MEDDPKKVAIGTACEHKDDQGYECDGEVHYWVCGVCGKKWTRPCSDWRPKQ